jgi:sec-independent protein translocase protein TatC
MLLTPPDVFSQSLLAFPMLVLFEVGLFVAYRIRRSDKGETEEIK